MLLIPIKTKQITYQTKLLILIKSKTHNALDTNGDEVNIKLKTHAYQLQILLPLFVTHQQRGKTNIMKANLLIPKTNQT